MRKPEPKRSWLFGKDQKNAQKIRGSSGEERYHEKLISWTSAIRLWIFSGAATTAVACSGWLIWQQILAHRASDPYYHVAALVQTGPEVEALPSAYLAEVLGLAQDHPVNLYQISLSALRKKILLSPCVAEAHMSRAPPKALQVSYVARQPIAICADLRNALIDQEGTLLPYQPFYRPRRLPRAYFGVVSTDRMTKDQKLWGRRLPPELVQYSSAILKSHLWNQSELLWIDVSQAASTDLSQSQIVLQFTHADLSEHPLWVRLSPQYWESGLRHLESLLAQPAMLKNTEIIDLRMPRMALLVPGKKNL